MKNKFLTLMMIVCSTLFLVNCAKNNSSNSNAAAAVGTTGVCTTAGYVYTQYGCAPQSSSCQTGWGYINGSCYPPTASTNSCPVGYVQTQMGCGQQSTMCGANYTQYGYVNGQCYPITNTTGTIGGVGGSCQAGYVGTVMGCLPQGSCPTGYGYYYGSYNGQTGGWCYQRTY